MQLLCVRHGEASWQAERDELRPLTERGAHYVSAAAHALSTKLPTFDLAIVSPYLRAQQTFKLISEPWDVRKSVSDALFTPDVPSAQAIERLAELTQGIDDNASVLLVSHNPLISQLVGELCEGVGSYEPFDTGTMALLDLCYPATGLGQLLWKH